MFYFQENRGRKRTFLESSSSQLPQLKTIVVPKGKILGDTILLFFCRFYYTVFLLFNDSLCSNMRK